MKICWESEIEEEHGWDCWAPSVAFRANVDDRDRGRRHSLGGIIGEMSHQCGVCLKASAMPLTIGGEPRREVRGRSSVIFTEAPFLEMQGIFKGEKRRWMS